MRQASREGIELIKRFEGLELQAYQDVAGIWTIGYGHTGPEVGPGMRISEGDAERLLIDDLVRFEQGVSAAVRAVVTQSQFDALVSLSYNIGVAAFSRSTAVRRLNKGDYDGAAEAITWWNKATVNGRKVPIPGLTRRRAAEAALFLSDVDDALPGGATAGVRIEEGSPRRSNPLNSRTVGGATTAGAAGAAGVGSAVLRDRDEPGGPVVVAGDADAITGAPAPDAAPGEVADAGPPPASVTGRPVVPAEGCVDPVSGQYLRPGDKLPGDPAPDGPIDGDAAPGAIEAATCEEAVVAQGDEGEAENVLAQDRSLAEASTVATTEQPLPPPSQRKDDVADAVGIGAGALAVLSAIYVVAARVDDWLNFRR